MSTAVRPFSADLAAYRSGEHVTPGREPIAVNPDLTARRPRGRRRRGPVETMDYAAMMRRMVRAYGRRVADCDVEDLAELIALRDVLDDAIADAVTSSRDRWGRSWSDIARATGTTRQAAQQRWGDR